MQAQSSLLSVLAPLLGAAPLPLSDIDVHIHISECITFIIDILLPNFTQATFHI